MLDIRLFRGDDAPETLRRLKRRGPVPEGCDKLAALDEARRGIISSVEEKKSQRNAASKEIGALKKAGEPAEDKMAAVRELGAEISEQDEHLRRIDSEIEAVLMEIPNLPADDLPDTENRVIKEEGERRSGAEPHWDIGERLGLIDFAAGTKISGARFYLLKGLGAKLERALINYMLELAIDKGYEELITPYLVSSQSMEGTGQFPKFRDEAFVTEKDDLALIPTAEVPVTNLHREEILENLPLKYVAHTPCFRREAGSYGKDTRGLVRVHQFNKVELVQFVEPDRSGEALEELTRHAEEVLEGLGLPYRRILLAANDIGFSATKTYDLEIWMPGLDRYLEVSSCSNFGDFQARRMKIRYRTDPKSKPELLHTLNGSAVAVGRTFAAILENYVQPDGSVRIPEALQPFMGNLKEIKPPSE